MMLLPFIWPFPIQTRNPHRHVAGIRTISDAEISIVPHLVEMRSGMRSLTDGQTPAGYGLSTIEYDIDYFPKHHI